MEGRPYISPALACALLVASAARADEGRLVGRVLDRATDRPIAGARVEGALDGAEPRRADTDAEGRFALPLPAGAIAVSVFAEGHDLLEVRETIAPGEGLSVEYRLTPEGDARRRRYRSTVRGESRHEGARFSLEGEALRTAPGTLGDPFRVVALLPGVASPVPLLPFYSIRGASPGDNGFFLDGLRVPQLFHLLFGGGVVHPQLVDRLDFYPSAFGVSFGRITGGVIDSETRPGRAKDGRIDADLELRLYEVSGVLDAHLPELGGLRLLAAAHYGYPTAIVRLVQPGVDIGYWDYQLRLDWRAFTLLAFGSDDAVEVQPDAVGVANSDPFRTSLRFHRAQLRGRWRRGPVEAEAALWGGYDFMSAANGTGVEKLAIGARAHVLARWSWLRLHGGLEAEVSRFTPKEFGDGSVRSPDAFGELAEGRAGVTAGAFAEAQLRLPHDITVTAGVRADAYHAGAVTVFGLDPRASVRAQLLPNLAVQVSGGVYQQPPTFPIALPGIDTFALGLGLQRAAGFATTLEARLPLALALTATGYYQRFARESDVDVEFSHVLCASPPPAALVGLAARILRQVDGAAYGMELLLRRAADAGRWSGWISYTLGRAERAYSCGLRPSDFDQTHVLNVVAQVRLPARFLLGLRLYVATGRPYTRVDLLAPLETERNNERLPTYVQLDLRVDRDFDLGALHLGVFLEALNLTFSESVLGVTYPEIAGVTRYDQPQPLGFRFILPSLGLRARF